MILLTEYIESAALTWLRRRAECYYGPNLYQRLPQLKQQLRLAKGLIVRNQTQVNAELLACMPQLCVVGRLGTGLDNLDREELANRKIQVVYAPGINANAVAELCLGYMLAHSRNLLWADRTTRAGTWQRTQFVGQELRGRVVGIIGLGSTGSRLATLCQALGCHVLTTVRGPYRGVPQVPLSELLAQSDFVSIHVPLLPETKHLIGEFELQQMQHSALLINTARGEIVDEDALFTALQAKRIAGAALDVRQQEPPRANDRFHNLDNVILTPHLAGWTTEAQRSTCQVVVEDVWRVLHGEPPLHPAPTT